MARAKQNPAPMTTFTPIRTAFIAGEITEAEAYKQMGAYQKVQKARRSKIDPPFDDAEVRTLVNHWKTLRRNAA